MSMKLGSAAWADAAAVAQRHPYRAGTLWLGRLPDHEAVGCRDDRHVCLVSGSRAGKGTSAIINNLCLWPGSAVVIDPKGENATVTAARRGAGSAHAEAMGQDVHVLDPFGAATVDERYRSRFNPFDALDPEAEQCVDEAARLADALVVVHDDSKDPFWDESARALVKGLILHVLTAEEFDGRRTLVTLRMLITRGDWEAVELLREAGQNVSAYEHLWHSVYSNQALGGVVAGIGSTFLNMLLNSPKQFESVLQVANRNTEFLDSPGLQRCVSASDFKLSDLKRAPNGLTLYLSLPQRYMATHYRWLRMMIALTVTEMELVRGRPATGHPVLMVLDEFAGLRRMEVIENAAAQIAGYGVKLWFVVQSLEQLKAVYKENWETFLANSGLKMFFGIEDHFSREYVSKLIGETELMRDVRSESDTLTESESESETVGTSESHSTSVSAGKSRSTTGGGLFMQPGTVTVGQSSGWSSTTTYGTSHSHTSTQGTSHGRTTGVAETVHKRALLSPDEIGRHFARVDDRTDPAYPGFMLALIAGQQPVSVRRVNYFEDYDFLGRFDPHPDHAMKKVARTVLPVDGLRPYLDYWPDLRVSPHDCVGRTVFVGQSIASVSLGRDGEAALLTPSAGCVVALGAVDGADALPEQLAEILHYQGEPAQDPYVEIAELSRQRQAVLAERLRHWAKLAALAAVLLLIPIVNLFGSRTLWTIAPVGALLIFSASRLRAVGATMARYPFGFSFMETLFQRGEITGQGPQEMSLWQRIDRALDAATSRRAMRQWKAAGMLALLGVFYFGLWQLTSSSPEDEQAPVAQQAAVAPVNAAAGAAPGAAMPAPADADRTTAMPAMAAPDLDSLHELCLAIAGADLRNLQLTSRQFGRSFAYDASRGLACSFDVRADSTVPMRTIAVFEVVDPGGPGVQEYVAERDKIRRTSEIVGAALEGQLALPTGALGYPGAGPASPGAAALLARDVMRERCMAIAGANGQNAEFADRGINRGLAFDAARGQGCWFSIRLPDGTESLRPIAIFDMRDPNGPGAREYALVKQAAQVRVIVGGTNQDGAR